MKTVALLSILWICGFPAAALVGNPALARESQDAAPKRIITLTPSLAEITAEVLGPDLDRIVGVSNYTNYPAALLKKPRFDTYKTINMEALLALKPDLVLASQDGNPKDEVTRLKELGVPVVTIRTQSLTDIEDSLRRVGEICGKSGVGQQLAIKFRDRLNAISKSAAAKVAQNHGQKPRVLLVIETSPLIIAGGASFINDAMKALGVKNIYGDLSVSYPKPSLEDVIARDPQIILALAPEAAESKEEELKQFTFWNRFASIKAVKEKRIYIVKDESLVRPSPRILTGLEKLEVLIYGK